MNGTETELTANYEQNILKMRELVLYTIETQVTSISGTVYTVV